MGHQIVEGGENPCPRCPPIPTQAPMAKVIFVGFGEAEIKRDGMVVLDCEKFGHENDWENFKTFADAEEMAAADPDHSWLVRLYAPLHGETYERQGPGVWLCIRRNDGFA